MDTKTKVKIESYCPIFNGFYNTIWEYDETSIIEAINYNREKNNINGKINFEHLEIDYKQYEKDISKTICEAVQDNLSEYIISIEYQGVYNPKEYNFKTDSINCIIEPNIDNIKKFIYDNKAKFIEFLKNRYTSFDGFISYYSNDFETWQEDSNNFTDFNMHSLGSILDFIALHLEIDNILLYNDIYDNFDVYEYISNYDILESCFICSKCDKIIENDNIINTIKKYKDITNINPSIIYCDDCMNDNY